MAFRVLYAIPGRIEPDEESRRLAILRSYFPKGVEVSIWSNRAGPVGIASQEDIEKSLPGMRRFSARLGMHAPYGAVVVGCFVDPGLEELRRSVQVPVIGPGESSLAEAVKRGSRVGIVTLLEETIPTVKVMLSRSYAGDVPMYPIGLTGSEIRKSPDEALERSISAISRLAEQEDVDVVCMGCMGFSWSGVAKRLLEVSLPAEVIDPLAACAKALADCIKQHSPNGSSCSKLM